MARVALEAHSWRRSGDFRWQANRGEHLGHFFVHLPRFLLNGPTEPRPALLAEFLHLASIRSAAKEYDRPHQPGRSLVLH